MANLDKQSQEVLKATMEFIEDTIRDLVYNKPKTHTKEQAEKLALFKAIREGIWKLKQKNFNDFYLFPNRTRDEIGDLTSKVNDLIAKNSADIKQIFNGNNPTLPYPDTIKFKESKLTPHDVKEDDSLTLGFIMRSSCSEEKELPKTKPQPTRWQEFKGALPDMPQPRPGIGKYILAGSAASFLITAIPPVGIALAVGTLYALAKDSSQQTQIRGTVERQTRSASEEHCAKNRVSLPGLPKSPSFTKLSPAQQHQQQQQQQQQTNSNPSPPNPGAGGGRSSS